MHANFCPSHPKRIGLIKLSIALFTPLRANLSTIVPRNAICLSGTVSVHPSVNMSDAPAQEQVAAPVAAPAAEVAMTDAPAPAPVEAPVAAAPVAAAPVEEKKAEEAPKQERRDNRQQPRKEYKKRVNNSKYDASSLPVTDDPVAIRTQVIIPCM